MSLYTKATECGIKNRAYVLEPQVRFNLLPLFVQWDPNSPEVQPIFRAVFPQFADQHDLTDIPRSGFDAL
jgi:hypothetical protein